ncbi:MAG: prephenate dehydrogenase [Bacteroides sp.]
MGISMINDTFHFGFIGLGLIGGSIARALKISFPGCFITAYSRTLAPLELAKAEGNLDVITTDIDSEAFGQCDYIFICTPVQYISSYLDRLVGIVHPECTITDVGSVKSFVHDAASKAGLDSVFIGGHPMTGSEKTGYANSSAILLENAYYIITPTKETTDAKLQAYVNLVKSMGAIPIVIDYNNHDYYVAGISHLPHLIAGSLVNLIHDTDSDDGMMKRLAAGGFKDITRIASSSPEMWEQICMTNTDAILKLLNKYIASLNDIKEHLEAHEEGYIYKLFERSGEYRNSMNDSSRGALSRAYLLHLDIEDREGAIANVATLLARNSISIKNIGIVHNREYEHGALCMEFYDRNSKELAAKLLTDNNYLIYH